MKQGSTDDPFAEGPAEESVDKPDDEQRPEESSPGKQPESTDSEDPMDTDSYATAQTRSLPYIHARDGVKDGRTQRPIFLREEVEAGIDDLVDQMEDEFGETVYKTDITEAAMVVAQKNPELLCSTLEEWGYGWS